MSNKPDSTSKATSKSASKTAAAETRLTIGDLVKRSGVAASALRFYEEQGLLSSQRSASESKQGGRRHYARGDLRRLAFIRAAQTVGLSLEQIRAALAELPEGRTPTPADWQRLSTSWRPILDQRIAELTRLRDTLSSCIGCGCLSLSKCALYNPADAAGKAGAGARYLIGDSAAKVMAEAAKSAPARRAAAPAAAPVRVRKR
ncbi:redox-sensitive transcriptional activator SoxR [Roseateles oligotrophus]|uniref:Redox-sensitive transcriptional activator SoxR n=1 Tax=Roseateles oligotrophus TaxID=1769250 RepID=A0ABT2Y9D2_9BURK|nr:redox-sensitive transcriptional activator SoxR [Roseateles oligotrophus]MCV2366888.1 redox-sensitive transcriptional activator SoxR [Roseateles oligotrophus]